MTIPRAHPLLTAFAAMVARPFVWKTVPGARHTKVGEMRQMLGKRVFACILRIAID